MKKKLILTILCIIGFCLVMACKMDYDKTTMSGARSAGTSLIEGEETETDNLVIDENEQEFFRNQSRSFSIMDEAMRPFIIETDETGSRLYDDCFAGVFLDDFGNINIGYVQNVITRQVEDSMKGV